jgi:hypothetical protein
MMGAPIGAKGLTDRRNGRWPTCRPEDGRLIPMPLTVTDPPRTPAAMEAAGVSAKPPIRIMAAVATRIACFMVSSL